MFRVLCVLLVIANVLGQDSELSLPADPVVKSCACFALYAPVCGVDGNTYSNSCHAECAKVKIKCQGECPCKGDCKELVLCKKNPCADAKCPAFPTAHCRPNQCNQCLAEFFIKGRKVNCIRKFPPCPPFRTNVYCPNPCPGPGCPKYPHAKCRRKNCYGCAPEYYVGSEIVDCQRCVKKRECETNQDCCGEYCCKCGRSGVFDPDAKPPKTGHCTAPGKCLCPPTVG